MEEQRLVVRFYESLADDHRPLIKERLNTSLGNCVTPRRERDSGCYAHPLWCIKSPDAAFYQRFAAAIPGELDILLARQDARGRVHPAARRSHRRPLRPSQVQ